ncbi:SPFH domain-containing protein [Sediminitomix flava]|uniref:Membrane protease subunit (Stomatin/prohibitin family) n=1 Tax=Sediminitomix flava TaxID=379075 RepID=A0A315YVW3_SEDFL|nr:SPFH domain-containing protein [Sediminitomix flava]PWJ33672.1 membrane protease subunit (stomatin/prohibitin family) [Sediminitomix flava]
MGFFDRNIFIDIIEWLPENDDLIVYKYDRHDNEIKNGAQLIVRESQVAVIIEQGQFADVFYPGTHTLSTENIPLLSDLRGWKHGFDSPFVTEVYYINTKFITDLGWGTPNEIMLRDADFGIVRISAYGSYHVKVNDPVTFLKEVSGVEDAFTTEMLDEKLMPFVLSNFTDTLGEAKVPALDLAMKYKEIGDECEVLLQTKFDQFGIEIANFIVENISLPESVQEAIDQRASMGAIGNMNTYQQYQMGNAMGNVGEGNSEGGSVNSTINDAMQMGMNMGMASNMINQMMGMQRNAQAPQNQQAPPPVPSGPGAPPPVPGAAPSQLSFHISSNGSQYGPYTLDQLKQYVAEGRVNKDTMVWREGMPAWAPMGTHTETASLFGGMATPPPPPPPM